MRKIKNKQRFSQYSILLCILLIALCNCTTTIPISATNNSIGEKEGISRTTVILGTVNTNNNLATGLIVSNSEFGVIEAVKNGKIELVSTVDMKIANYFFFKRVELIVNGH
ncbi:MAG: hypothetical protein JJT77_02690 [Crocinitomicaceae bacterium]|nr:hypothetical protein [Crocinitomicaceae bacterium]